MIYAIKVYGVLAGKHLEMDISELLLKVGGVLEIKAKNYKIFSIIKKNKNLQLLM